MDFPARDTDDTVM